MQPFTKRIIDLIRSIPEGRVTSYGNLATMAGNRSAARQVARILHTYSTKLQLPWHRVVNKDGMITIANEFGRAEQRALLESEGISFTSSGTVDMNEYMWRR